jgi:hypothetical protein
MSCGGSGVCRSVELGMGVKSTYYEYAQYPYFNSFHFLSRLKPAKKEGIMVKIG